MSLKEAAMTAPDVSSERQFFTQHEMTCHMAAIYWAFITLGKTPRDATRALKTITASLCDGCKTRGPMHGSLNYNGYAKHFCIGHTHPMDDLCMVGDVVITPDPRMPMHSMVVVERPDRNTVHIRAFNNTNTFPGAQPPAPYMRYDPTTRNLADRTSAQSNKAYYIKSMTYVRAALTTLTSFGG